MSFLNIDVTQAVEGQTCPPTGPKNAKIALVGEAPGVEEARFRQPFVGPSGQVLDQCLQSAGLLRRELYITNFLKHKPPNNDISPWFNGKAFTSRGMQAWEDLKSELNDVGANVLVPLGNTALFALTGLASITKCRGYVWSSRGLSSPRKVIPTIHPAATLRGAYIQRYYISADLRKIKAESERPEVLRPARNLRIQWTFGDVIEYLNWLKRQPRFGFDIEVMNFEVSCIAFATSPTEAVSIPIYRAWSEGEEMAIWRGIAAVLENPESKKVVQNGIFDIQFLAIRCGILVANWKTWEDAMVAHHIIYPEFPKGLEFLVSLYCGAQEHYKDMVRFDNIKKES